MRVGVFSDVHADLDSLERVFRAADTAGVDEGWCLGDIVGLGGTDAAKVVERIRDECAIALAGNHDAWVTGALPLDPLPLPRQRRELAWQRSQLSDEQFDWLAALPSRATGSGVELWHGSADDPVTGWIATEADAEAHLARQRAMIGLAGHTHRPGVARRRGATVTLADPPTGVLRLSGADTWLLNPGAVARDARWLELDLGEQAARWHHARRDASSRARHSSS